MKKIFKSFSAVVTTAALLSTTAFAAVVDRDVFNDSFIINSSDGKEYTVKMSDSDGRIVHASFFSGDAYTFKLSDDVKSGDKYTLLLGNADSEEAEKITGIYVYSLSDKLAVLNEINSAENEDALKTILKENAGILEIDRDTVYDAQSSEGTISDSDINAVSKAVFGNSFDDIQKFYAAVYNTRGLLLLNRAADAETAKSIGGRYKAYLGFDKFNGYDLITGFEDEIYPFYMGKNKTTPKEAEEAFGEYAFLCAVSKTENYQQVLDIFNNHSDLVTFDLSAWNNSVKSETAKALVAGKYDSMDALKAAVDAAVGKQSGNSGSKPSGGGSGSGGGGGSFAGAAINPKNDNASSEQKPLYNDLNESHWAYETIKYLTENNVVNGDPYGNFNPENYVTRGEFAKMLVSGFGLYDETAAADFADVPENHWAYKYIASLFQKGIVSGIDETTFGADMLITRQDMAVMLSRISSNFSSDGELSFADGEEIAQYAKNAVSALCGLGIINGYEDNTYRPYGNAVRAEAAVVVSRGMKLFMGGTDK